MAEGVGSALVLLFAYGSLLPGERDAALLGQARCLGAARTAPGFRLVDLGPYPALIAGGNLAIEGELFELDVETLRRVDAKKELGRLFHRRPVLLEDGREAQAYFMDEPQVRGRRRLRGGDWRRRFEPVPSARSPRR